MKRSRLIFLFSKKFNNRRKFSQKKIIYWPISKKINKFAYEYFIYRSAQMGLKWLKTSYINVFFIKNILKLKIDLLSFFYRRDSIFTLRKKKFNNLILLYKFFFLHHSTDLFNFLFIRKKKINKFFFYMHWTFKPNQRLYINLQNYKRRNFFFLSSGFFLKYFEKRKALKKNKSLKILLAKYIRKLYLLIKLKYTLFFIRSLPTYLSELINTLNTPIIHKFSTPFNDKLFEDLPLKKNIFNINYFIFIKNIDFANNKIRKKGRIKRKITRKIVLQNSIID